METGNPVSEVNSLPLISVIIPAYCIEQDLPACLDSVLQQTYPNLEIIVVNDGSQDGTGAAADRCAAAHPGRIRVIHKENGGVTSARLAGIAAASGSWIGFVDGDDVIEPDMYQRLLDNALKYDADISHCGSQTVVNGGERIHYFYNTGRLVVQDRMTGIRDLLSGTFVEPSLWNKLFRRELIETFLQKDTMDTSIRICEDLLMNFYLFRIARRSVYEDFCPYHYLARVTSATRSGFRPYKVLDPLHVREHILQQVEEPLKAVATEKYLVACMLAVDSLYGHPEYREECRKLQQVLRSSRKDWQLLGKRDRVKMVLTIISPRLFRLLYEFYERHFQKKIYE